MKTVIAIIKPFKFDEVQQALIKLGFDQFTAVEASTFTGRSTTEIYRGHEYKTSSFLPRTEVKITVPDEKVASVAQAIKRAAYTGRIGDGWITVVNVEQYWDIKTDANETHPVTETTAVTG